MFVGKNGYFRESPNNPVKFAKDKVEASSFVLQGDL
jgi:hypothetical protein